MNPIVDEFGTKKWTNEIGLLHREDGPAIEYTSGSRSWYKNGLLHREDGPAIEHVDGTKEYWSNGKKYTKDFTEIIKKELQNNKKLRQSVNEEYFIASIASEVYQAREKAKLTQKQLSELSNVPIKTIEKIEQSDYNGNYTKLMFKLADSLNKKVKVIFVD